VDRSLPPRVRAANAALLADGNLESVRKFFTLEYVAHLTEQTLEDHEAIRGFVKMVRGAFPDLRVEVGILVEGGDRVAWQRILRETHQGDFMGVPASGHELVWRDMITSRFEDGPPKMALESASA
jgi:predicted ester cyclase